MRSQFDGRSSKSHIDGSRTRLPASRLAVQWVAFQIPNRWRKTCMPPDCSFPEAWMVLDIPNRRPRILGFNAFGFQSSGWARMSSICGWRFVDSQCVRSQFDGWSSRSHIDGSRTIGSQVTERLPKSQVGGLRIAGSQRLGLSC